MTVEAPTSFGDEIVAKFSEKCRMCPEIGSMVNRMIQRIEHPTRPADHKIMLYLAEKRAQTDTLVCDQENNVCGIERTEQRKLYIPEQPRR
jgi:hypothetical protein